MIRVPEWCNPNYNEEDALKPCSVCGNGLAPYDEFRCRHCDPVERINALAEKYAKVRDGIAPLWVEFMNYGKKTSFIKCADIILESE